MIAKDKFQKIYDNYKQIESMKHSLPFMAQRLITAMVNIEDEEGAQEVARDLIERF